MKFAVVTSTITTMAIPGFQSFMLPVLRRVGDGEEHRSRDVTQHVADELGLTESERGETLPSGQKTRLNNRVDWARSYLTQAGLLTSPRKGWVRITPRGQQLLQDSPPKIDIKYLMQFDEFVAFRKRRRPTSPEIETTADDEISLDVETPEESLDHAYQNLRRQLADELLKQVMAGSAAFFEKLVVELLLNMGYGGSRRDAGQAIGKSGDGGIDGIIKEDRLGFDAIYIQAKKWDGPISRPELQKFVGALQDKKSKKGLFITTSTFSQPAIDYAARIDIKVVLIDGEQLAELMIDHNVGTATTATYDIKRIDLDYFTEE